MVTLSRPVPRSAFDVMGLIEIASGNRFDLEQACRAQVQPIYLGDHTGLCRVLGRLKLFVDTRDHGFGANVLLDGFWEMWLSMVMARVLKPGMTAVDIGANFGYYSLLMADLVGDAGKVVAVEPNPAARDFMTRSLLLNGMMARSRIVAAAAHATSQGTTKLFVPHHEPKNAVILSDPGGLDLHLGTLSDVALWCLDDAAGEIGRIDFIKIDAEGAEEEILAGMSRTLQRDRPILVLEYNRTRYSDPGAILDGLIAIYDGFHAISVEGVPVPMTRDAVLGDTSGEDLLLYFSLDPAAAMPLPRNPKRRSLR